MKNRGITTISWVAAIAATAYLTKGQEQEVQFLIIILLVLGASNIFLVKDNK